MPKQLNEFAPDVGGMPELGAGVDADMQSPEAEGGHDHEGAMAKADLFKLANYSLKLFKQMEDSDQLEAWVQAKITKAADYIASVFHYLEYEMKFSEYGSKLENSDVYSESEKLELKNKLNEAKEMLRAIKIQQANRLDEGKKAKKDYDGDGKVESGKDEYLGSKIKAAKKAGKMEESMGGEACPCEACGGTGQVMSPAKSWSPEAKSKAAAYNRKAKAYAAATKRIDANKNGIPDDEEPGEQKAPAKKAAGDKAVSSKKPEADSGDKPAGKKSATNFGQGIYEGEDEGKPGKNFAKIAKKAGAKYGSKEAGERVAGAVRAKLAKAGKLEEVAKKSDIPAAQRKAKGGDWKVTTKDLKDEESAGKISHADTLAKNKATVKEGVMDTVGNAIGDLVGTDASLERRSPQLQQLIAMRQKYPTGSDEARQLDARIKALKDRLSIDGTEVAGQGGMPKPVVDPATFKQQNPNFKYEDSMNESVELNRMKEFLTRLNG